MKVIGIIPARFQSSRFPAKMLHPLLGTSLLQRTYECSKKSKTLDQLVIATDDMRIFEHAKSFGADVVMTSIDCLNGTERLVDAITRHPELADGDIYVNIQGDRPCLPAQTIDALVDALRKNPTDLLSTPLSEINDPEELLNPSSVKCVVDKNGYALYFSRAPISYSKTGRGTFYKHVGLYAFRKDFLFEYTRLENTPLMLQEDLEQLKVLE